MNKGNLKVCLEAIENTIKLFALYSHMDIDKLIKDMSKKVIFKKMDIIWKRYEKSIKKFVNLRKVINKELKGKGE